MNPAPNLVLVGPMGAGKSALGRRLAERFGLRFVDLDQAIEAAAGRTIPAIFASDGEAAFRALERARLAELLTGEGLVLATGGGAVLDAGSRAAMRARGFVVHLHVDVDTQLQRLARDRKRPLLAVPDRETVLRRLSEERAPLYAEVADLRFVSRAGSLGDACGRLSVLLRDRWTPALQTPSGRPDEHADDRAADIPLSTPTQELAS